MNHRDRLIPLIRKLAPTTIAHHILGITPGNDYQIVDQGFVDGKKWHTLHILNSAIHRWLHTQDKNTYYKLGGDFVDVSDELLVLISLQWNTSC